jgi:FlaA1/EpsC-like NDP-sugar epimerase
VTIEATPASLQRFSVKSRSTCEPVGQIDAPESLGLAQRSESKAVIYPLTQATRATAQGYRWKRSHAIRVLLVDAIAVICAVVLASIGRFGLPHDDASENNPTWTSVAIYSVALVIIWLIALGVQHSRDLTLVGVGAEEYRLVLTATFWVFGIIAAAGLVAREQMARGYLLIAFPAGLVGLVIGRHLLRRHLARRRSLGKFMNHVVVLGAEDSVESLCMSFERSKDAGYKVIGACVVGLSG